MSSTWRHASFRGAEFLVESFDRSGGRRGPNHEFPNKEEGYAEDTGKLMESFSIEAYVARGAGDPDYAARRDALIEALNKKGPGELVHPAFGTIKVQVREWSQSETRARQGKADFVISCVEANKEKYPTAQKSAAAGMPALADAAHRAAQTAFARDFGIAGKSDFLAAAARHSLGRVGDLFALIGNLFAVPFGAADLLADVLALVGDGVRGDNAVDIAAAVSAFPRAVTGWYETPHRATRNGDGTYRGVSGLRGNGPLSPEASTALFRAFDFSAEADIPRLGAATRQTQRLNAEAVAAMTRRSAIVEAARVAPFIDWRTLQDAENTRDRIAGALDSEAVETDDDDLYAALSDMRTLILRTVAPDDDKLPALVEYTPPRTMPALSLSHSLYGAADRAAEIAEINGLRHPGFVPGMERIRILSNA